MLVDAADRYRRLWISTSHRPRGTGRFAALPPRAKYPARLAPATKGGVIDDPEELGPIGTEICFCLIHSSWPQKLAGQSISRNR